LLIERDYNLKLEKGEDPKGAKSINLRYSVGQPMGALSSFNMLAVTHHFLVQLAYQRTLPFYKRTNILLFVGELK
jgi:hypothetical protein